MREHRIPIIAHDQPDDILYAEEGRRLERERKTAQNLWARRVSIGVHVSGCLGTFIWGWGAMSLFAHALESQSSFGIAMLVIHVFLLPITYILVSSFFRDPVECPQRALIHASLCTCRHVYLTPWWFVFWIWVLVETIRRLCAWVGCLGIAMVVISYLLLPTNVRVCLAVACCRGLPYHWLESTEVSHCLLFLGRRRRFRMTGNKVVGQYVGDVEDPEVEYRDVLWRRRGWIVMLRARADGIVFCPSGTETTFQELISEVVNIEEPGVFQNVVGFL